MTDKEWVKRSLFLQWVEDAKAKLRTQGHKGTKVEVALLMGLKPNSMKKYTAPEWNGQKPGAEALRLLGDFLGTDYRLLMDGPEVAPAGIPKQDWEKASEDLRNFTIRMFYQGAPLSKQQLDAVEKMVKAGRALGRDRKAQGK